MIHEYPYTNFNEYNLDWCVGRIRDLSKEWAETHEEWTTVSAAWESYKTYIDNYFQNLDVTQEISDKLDQMAADGTLTTIMAPYFAEAISEIPAIVSEWIDDNLMQEVGYVIDASLTTANAAADAKVTGQMVRTIMPTSETQNINMNTTINLLDPDTITAGYILTGSPPTPTVNANYYYTDYIKIGMVPFYVSYIGTVSGNVMCYDYNKEYLGSIDYTHNTAGHYFPINPTASANKRYTMFIPLDGTVYITVNAPLNRPKMVTPFFHPMQYGATDQSLAYNDTFSKEITNKIDTFENALPTSASGEIFKKYSHKVAMFGDSITLGRDGNSNTIFSKNIPYYLGQLTGWDVTNYGVGSMGWVSTQYNPDIAYDKISSVDLSSYDVITLCYGVNDTQADMGTWDSTDESTICGQINKCINYIGTNYNKAKIILIAPFNTGGSGTFPHWRYPVVTARGWSRQMLSDEEAKIANYYGITFISQEDSPIMGYGIGDSNNDRTYQFLGADDVHPTADGHMALGHWLSAKIIANIV